MSMKWFQTFTHRGMQVFVLVWVGQLFSVVGTYLTDFALGVWVFQRTGSATQFALITVCIMVPTILVSPLAGVLADRYDRRWVMILSDSGAAIGTFMIAVLFLSERLEVWHIYLATAFTASFSAFQLPAYTAAIPLLVPKEHLGRANGMTQLSQAVARVLSPLLGGTLLIAIRMSGVIAIDIVTYLVALFSLLIIRFPRHNASGNTTHPTNDSFLQEAVEGWNYIVVRPGLLRLLIFFTATQFTFGIVITLISPLVLSFASSFELGIVMSVSGIGMVLGSILMTVWGGPKQRMLLIFSFTCLKGIILFLGGLQPSIVLIACAAGLFLFSEPLILGNESVIWQSKVHPTVLGRVLAIRNMITFSSLPVAAIVAGPLADYVFEPMMSTGGLLAGSFGGIIGIGPGRGIGLLFILMGGLTLFATILAYFSPRLRLIEEELPDIIPEEPLPAL